MNALQNYFNDYATQNYTNRDMGSFERDVYLSTSFASAARMTNSVPGDNVNSVFSPQRAGFYADAIALFGTPATFALGVAAKNQWTLQLESAPQTALAAVGCLALTTAGFYIGKQARSAVHTARGIIKERKHSH